MFFDCYSNYVNLRHQFAGKFIPDFIVFDILQTKQMKYHPHTLISQS